jgi:hypothetical protein
MSKGTVLISHFAFFINTDILDFKSAIPNRKVPSAQSVVPSLFNWWQISCTFKVCGEEACFTLPCLRSHKYLYRQQHLGGS